MMCGVMFSGHCELDLEKSAYGFRVNVTSTLASGLNSRIIVSGTYLLHDIGVLNVVCGYKFGSQNVAYCSSVIVSLILTSGLSSRKIVSDA